MILIGFYSHQSFPPLISCDLRRSCRNPLRSRFRWCRGFQAQQYPYTLFASLLTLITRVSLCVDVQAPAALKKKASVTAL